jgi:HK97 family phage portal protein
MAVIDTVGGLQITRQNWSPGIVRSGVRLYDSFNYEYATIYRTQPNVRTCVDFLSRNIAQLGLHVFRRVSDTDRARLVDHGLAQRLAMPLPAVFKVTRYRFIESLMGDLGTYFNAYWLKARRDGELFGLLRVPPPYVHVVGGLLPTEYEITLSGKMRAFQPEDVVHFKGYNPENPLVGLSPLETLRRVLAEEHEMGEYRENFWANAARQSGIIKRPLSAPDWSQTARERFTAEFEELYSGADNSGKTAVLEEGMEWEPNAFSAEQSEYLAGRKLTREECARAYHIPLPMVGILDHATFSNIQEQHKHLYQDSLGPWLAMIEQDIELQLLPDFEDTAGVYCEFNIAEKLQGDFGEQMKTFSTAVGRPFMTANEARARLNLPSLAGDADQLVTPLNVMVGGQASPRDATPEQRGMSLLDQKISDWLAAEETSDADFRNKATAFRAMLNSGQKKFDSYAPGLRANHIEKWVEVLSSHYRRQERAIVSRVPKGRKVDIGGVWFDTERWNKELFEDLLKLNLLTATAWAEQMVEQTGVAVSEERMRPWLEEHARISAEGTNEQMRVELEAALNEPEALDSVKNVFAVAIGAWALRQATSGVTTASNFGANEGARSARLTSKTWRTNSQNPRPEHAALSGVTIPIGQRFPTGQRWPGDPAGVAENNANCECSVDFS